MNGQPVRFPASSFICGHDAVAELVRAVIVALRCTMTAKWSRGLKRARFGPLIPRDVRAEKAWRELVTNRVGKGTD